MRSQGCPNTAVLVLALSTLTGLGCAARAPKEAGTTLSGRFVAIVDGPRLTSFGRNHESYIFETQSPGGPQFVRLSYRFLLYQPQVPRRTLDYSQVYKIAAVKEDACTETLEKISKTLVFNPAGDFAGTNFAITYAKNVPTLALPWKSPLPCYVLSPRNFTLVAVP
jgi:hypothetical protein